MQYLWTLPKQAKHLAPNELVLFDRASLSGDFLQELNQIHPWKGYAAIVKEWLQISGAIAFSVYWHTWWAYVLALFLIGGSQHGLGILMHEGTHYHFAKNKLWNDIISDWFCGFPVGASTNMFRQQHLHHHRHTSQPEDCEVIIFEQIAVQWPKSKWGTLWELLHYLLGLRLVQNYACSMLSSPLPLIQYTGKKPTRGELAGYLCFWALWGCFFTATSTWHMFFLYWFFPSITVCSAVFIFRMVSEHQALPLSHEVARTRNIFPAWYEGWLLAPWHVGYHLDHHLYPSVPFYSLPKLHQLLLKNDLYREKAQNIQTYLNWKHGAIQALSKEGNPAI